MISILVKNRKEYRTAHYLLNTDRRFDKTALPQKREERSMLRSTHSRRGAKRYGFLIASLCLGGVCGYAASLILLPHFVPAYIVLGALVPYAYISKKSDEQALDFLEDYPSVLMATASSVRAGLTPTEALARACKLLPERSLCRKETTKLLKKLHSGVSKRQALAEYGADIRLPILDLFRAAFLMVLESGGRFAPSLVRLAELASDTSILMKEARVATTSMRMTGTILLLVIPVILVILSVRNDDYWTTFFSHPVAHTSASVGLFVITLGTVILRMMSNFKP